jgi:hypothetical protein
LPSPTPLPVNFTLRWTRQPLRGWLARATPSLVASPQTAAGDLLVNRWLDSPDIEPAALQFLLWTHYLRLWQPEADAATLARLESAWDGAPHAAARLRALSAWLARARLP